MNSEDQIYQACEKVMDRFTAEKRSILMSKVHDKDTVPELFVRKLIHGLGYRYRLHSQLPGKPDMVFPSRKKIVLIHGCYWHGHGCPHGKLPKSNLDFWKHKIQTNKKRDAKNDVLLCELGYEVLKIWQCELNAPKALTDRLIDFLGRRVPRKLV